jgi:hypothetical protein
VQKDGDADSTQIEQEHAMNKFPLGWSVQTQESQIVDKESQKVLGPQEENFDSEGTNFIESLVTFGPSLFGVSSIAKASHGEE